MSSKRPVALRKLPLQPCDVLEQTLSYEADEIEAEPRILEVKLFNLTVADLQQAPRFNAFERLRAGALRRKKGKLTHHLRRPQLDADLDKPVSPGDHNEHGGGDISLLNSTSPACTRRVDVNGLSQSRLRSPCAASRTCLASWRI